MLDRRMLRNLDLLFIFVAILLLGGSLLVMSTASINLNSSHPYFYLKQQMLWIFTGLLLLIGVVMVDYHVFGKYAKWIYVFNLALLGAVLLFGNEAKGAARWIQIGGLPAIQPSEFAKIFIIICFADFVAKRKDNLNNFRDFIPCFLYIGVPMIMIVMQPDLGTGLVFGAIMLGIMLVGGAKVWKLVTVLIIVIAIAGGTIFAHLEFGMPIPLKEYQVKRITTLFESKSNQNTTSKDNAYQVMQSKVAIGSGGLWGKGYREGTQGQLNFLPEHHTDFVFSIVGEEFGFIGSITLLFLFLILLLRAIGIAAYAKDQAGVLMVSGVVAMLAFHILVNVGMTSGIMPVTGIPLPLISYGGSAMWSNMLALGLVINVSLRRKKLMF